MEVAEAEIDVDGAKVGQKTKNRVVGSIFFGLL